MDFVVGLARTQTDHDVIWMIVDRLTKLAHFLAVRSTFSLKRLAILYIDEVVKLHGVSVSIVSDWDLRTDGQSERTIQTLEDMLRACIRVQ